MMTTRKRVGPLLTPRLDLRYSVDYSSSDHFTSDDSSRDSSSSSSSETSSDSSSDALSDSSSSYLSSDHPSSTLSSGMRSSHQLCSLVPSIHHSSAAITERPSHTSSVGPSRKRSSYLSSDHPSSTLSSGMRSSHQLCSLVPSIHHLSAAITERPSHTSSVGPSRKRSRSPTTSMPVSSPIPGALSSVRAHLLQPRKRIMSSDSLADLEVSSAESSEPSRSRGTDLEMDVDVKRSDEPHSEPEIDPVETVIEACFDFANIIRGSRIDVRVEAVTVMCGSRKTSTRSFTTP
ncbi:hypothetical protein Tco_0261074 [Tanacetum coccineum]